LSRLDILRQIPGFGRRHSLGQPDGWGRGVGGALGISFGGVPQVTLKVAFDNSHWRLPAGKAINSRKQQFYPHTTFDGGVTFKMSILIITRHESYYKSG